MATMDDVNRVTVEWLQDHPCDLDAHMLYVMSDSWKLREVFQYISVAEDQY